LIVIFFIVQTIVRMKNLRFKKVISEDGQTTYVRDDGDDEYSNVENDPYFFRKKMSERKGLIYIAAAIFGIIVIGSFFSSPVFFAGEYTRLINIEPGNFSEDITEISYDQIPWLDKASAERLGNRKLGELADMVSQFEVAPDYTQINYKNRPVRVTPLLYGDVFKWFNNQKNGIPGYITIDMVTQEGDVVRLKEGMKYSKSEYFFRNIDRYIRFHYPTYMFEQPVFEIDDDGNPYWICPRIVKRISIFGGTDIEGIVMVNAVTGEHQYYAKDEIPQWVDHVYRAPLLIQQYDYYGRYQSGFLNSIFGQRNVTMTTDGYNYLALNDDVYMYTGITSVVGNDESNIGFILVNQRTKEATYYQIAGAHEYSAMGSAEGAFQAYDYTATFPLLLNIHGQPTYFMALKDYSNLVKQYAMVNVKSYNIVATGATVAECEENYTRMLSNNPDVDLPLNEDKISGTVDDIRVAISDGNAVYYIKLREASTYYAIDIKKNENVVLVNVGDKIEIAYLKTDAKIERATSFDWI
ncbi:MAG: hypothetical protein FWH46_05685, partial [Methanimicrococcus sp.]|nr:hypothetical protein [Methanimicrococcus sp.]